MKKPDHTHPDYITKDFFQKSIAALLEGIRREFTFALEQTEERISKKISEANDKTQSKLDVIVRELETMREDRIIGDKQTEELQKDVENHEARITKLEHTTP